MRIKVYKDVNTKREYTRNQMFEMYLNYLKELFLDGEMVNLDFMGYIKKMESNNFIIGYLKDI